MKIDIGVQNVVVGLVFFTEEYGMGNSTTHFDGIFVGTTKEDVDNKIKAAYNCDDVVDYMSRRWGSVYYYPKEVTD